MKKDDNILYTLKAKSDQMGGTTLIDHTKMVLNLVMGGIKTFSNNDNTLSKHAAISAICHDIGKINKKFQDFVNGKKYEEVNGVEDVDQVLYHNDISWAFVCSQLYLGEPIQYFPTASSVLYHHDVKYMNSKHNKTAISIVNEARDMGDIQGMGTLDLMITFYNELAKFVETEHGVCLRGTHLQEGTYASTCEKSIGTQLVWLDTSVNGFNKPASDIKQVSDLQSYGLMIRSVLVMADREASLAASRGDSVFISKVLANDVDYISKWWNDMCCTNVCFNGNFKGDEKRLREQDEIVARIVSSEKPIHDIPATAGYGKTMIGYKLFIQHRRKTLWCCPTNSITSGTYTSLVNEIERSGMGCKIKVGCFYGGQFQDATIDKNLDLCTDKDFDIIVMNIDSLLNHASRNDMASTMYLTLGNDVIFDEYHQMVCGNEMFAAFASIITARANHSKAKTLLLSATSYGDILDKIFLKSGVNNKIEHHKRYSFGGDVVLNIKYDEATTPQNAIKYAEIKDAVTLVPLVSIAQNMSQDKWILFHSLYTQDDKYVIQNKIYNQRGAGCEHKEKNNIIASPILGTGHNFSTQIMNVPILMPEEFIQNCGRVQRFFTNGVGYVNAVRYTDKNTMYFVKTTDIFDAQICEKWAEFLKEEFSIQHEATKTELYDMFDKFRGKYHSLYERWLLDLYDVSAKALTTITYTGGKGKKKDGKKTLPIHSYRGVNSTRWCVVQDVDSGQWKLIAIEDFRLKKHSEEENDGEIIKLRQKFVQKYCGKGAVCDGTLMLSYAADKKQLKYIYPSYTIEGMRDKAIDSTRPIPLFTFKYSKKGLIESNNINI